MTATHSIAPLPTRAEFIRDQLAEYLDGLGVPTTYGPVDHAGAVLHCDRIHYDIDVRIYGTGEMVDMDTGKLLTLKRFTWSSEARDTGTTHGPSGFYFGDPIDTPCTRCGDPVMGSATMHPTCKTLG